MKVDVHGWHTEIFLEDDEVKRLCKPGAGDDTCIFLVCGSKGFECAHLHGSLISQDLWDGKGNAKRKGCDFVLNNIIPSKLGLGIHEIYEVKDDK